LSNSISSQNITGIWRGFFYERKIKGKDNSKNENNIKFNFEVQIINDKNNHIKGVTYSYKSTEFYGKASFEGEINYKRKTINIVELNILNSKTTSNSDICTMTCVLNYIEKNSKYYLIGNFVSKNTMRKLECSSGEIILEKVNKSEFKKENFLFVKKEKLKNTIQDIKGNISEILTINTKEINDLIPITINELANTQNFGKLNNNTPVLDERLLRVTEVLKTIKTSSRDILIEYYDNGIIDNDTISIFENGILKFNKVRVSINPIVLKLKMDSVNNRQEVITVADNLGDISPNTTLMVITVKENRYEIPISTDYKTNVKVIIEYDANKEMLIQHY
jgi:2C-methyl-D-erythritol 2,4-cyclodiphosphate synthase